MMRWDNVRRWAAGALVALCAVPAYGQSPDSLPIFELRRAQFAPAPGYRLLPFAYPDHISEAMREPPYSLGVYVSDDPMLTDSDFAEIRGVSPGPEGLHLIVVWSAEGAARMARAIAIGEQVAWLVEGKLLGAAPLVGELTSELPQFILLRMPADVVARVAARLRIRAPR